MAWRDRLGYGFVRLLIRITMTLLTRTRVIGAEHLPRTGPGIVISNHIAAVDPAILVGVLPRPVALMSKAENNRGALRLFMPMVGAFTVRRGTADRRALHTSEQVLKSGRLLCLFPEGTRSPDGRLMAAHGGAALLTQKSGAPVIPVAITGTPQVFLRRFPWLGFPRVTVTIGKPFRVYPPSGQARRDGRAYATTELMVHIAALLPPDMRGAYAATPNYDVM